jgi:DNA gyrase subunit A
VSGTIRGVEIPDIDDGLDGRSRRCLSRLGTRYVRASQVVGDDRGDNAALIGLAQEFRLRYPLVDGDGNLGSVDGDPPADPQHTRVRLAPIARDLGRVPNLLVNGSRTIPPTTSSRWQPRSRPCSTTLRSAMDALLKRLPGPDFPTGGVIAEPSALHAVSATGRGPVRNLARSHLEGVAIVVTELPYGVEKGGDDGVIREIVELVFHGRMRGTINDIQDHTDRRGQRLLIGVERGTDTDRLLDDLYALTSLERVFPVDFVALVDGHPAHVTVRDLIDRFIAARDPATVRSELDELVARHGDERRTLIGDPGTAG